MYHPVLLLGYYLCINVLKLEYQCGNGHLVFYHFCVLTIPTLIY